MNRKIIHVDMDAFFASVEQLDFPELRGKPVIVGGTSSRGVVATCSYEAREFGVHSAMPNFQAKKLCPKGIYVHGRHQRYEEISREIFSLLTEITDEIIKVSIDEAYLDVTNLYLSPEYIAKYIKKKIKKETGLNISVGISYNMFLAKIASDWDKPDGLFIIRKEDMPDILKPLSIIKIHGLGKKSAGKLNNIGIYTIG
ncbi:MAG: DNA polymerase IV, partial [Clostridiales bacterium]|nr:DNA polymerase IV [Clostridiales bacterium]